jgi:catechol 2,3-dioxygenase-like lactoylglutathione lyase family enzyme
MAGSGITLTRLDHLVLTVRDIEVTCAFYEKVLGMRRESFGAGRTALRFGRQKINLHPHPSPIDTKAAVPTPGSADLCFIAETPVEDVLAHLQACGIAVEAGPVPRTGAEGPITSVYFRDPDGNLVEVSNCHSG